ncbi:VOC family protein [Bradyrhizobium sp. CCGUVB23]|uniref:VOC family protein n=1 Tax=Bradyrhizobium sp. CCGUVB23 TaxID=2949630 RepID=UPI0020B379E0|nr:VOC family protein [Bradyrhizobium sp. CCGUVB23]MCP3460630.1 VOC family protein [Bradyrhizobium sp. CCGUVB23]
MHGTEIGDRFEAIDGTSVVIAHERNPLLPTPPSPGYRLRKTVVGVTNMATLDTIAAELRRDRDVRYLDDGSIEPIDDAHFVIGFQISVRRRFVVMGEFSNAPGTYILRPINSLGVLSPASVIRPRTLSHVAHFVPDVSRAEAFYVNRLGFRCTDRFTGSGPFLQPADSLDHHTHFLIAAPSDMQGLEHFAFHFGGPTG